MKTYLTDHIIFFNDTPDHINNNLQIVQYQNKFKSYVIHYYKLSNKYMLWSLDQSEEIHSLNFIKGGTNPNEVVNFYIDNILKI